MFFNLVSWKHTKFVFYYLSKFLTLNLFDLSSCLFPFQDKSFKFTSLTPPSNYFLFHLLELFTTYFKQKKKKVGILLGNLVKIMTKIYDEVKIIWVDLNIGCSTIFWDCFGCN